MDVPAGYTRLEGSERVPAPGARRTGPADPDETVEVTILVRRPPGAPPLPDPAVMPAGLPPAGRTYLSREELAARYGAAREDLERVAAFARSHGLDVIETSAANRTVRVKGTVAQLSRAFGVELGRYETEAGSYRGREGPLFVPAKLQGVVEAVLGLDDRRLAEPLAPP